MTPCKKVKRGKRSDRHSLVCLLVLSLSIAARAQTGPTQGDTTDSISCWWRTSTGAVATGEPFGATLTCAVRDDSSEHVVADETRLGAQVMQLAPFEILGGSHPADLRSGTHRFFQYHYRVRLIDRDFIGKDAKFPDIRIGYRITGRAGGEPTEGRDRIYIVPGQPIHILSLVPNEADDIRDSGDESFARVESLRFRARALELIAYALAVLGLLVLAPALVRLVRRGSPEASPTPGRVPARRILAHVIAELDRVGRERHAGWTPDLVARAAAAVRLTAACALKRGWAEHPRTDGPPSNGLAVHRGLARRATLIVSSPVTASDVQKALAALPLTAPADTRQLLEDLAGALLTYTAALYRPVFEPGDPALDSTLATAMQSARRLKRAHAWPRNLRPLRAPIGRVEARA